MKDIIGNITGGSGAAHAYMIEGRSPSAREAFMKELAMGLECTSPDAGARPCGVCDACRQVAAGSSMDIVRMQMSGKTGYKTEDVNAFTDRLDMGAYGRFLIGMIDDADMMSETVQNKLLKTLEEPRPGVLIFLGTTNPDHLLATVRSRCSVIRMQGDDSGEEAGRAEAITAAAAMLGGGGAFHEFREAVEKCVKTRRDALELLDAAEDGFRDKMKNGEQAGLMADRIELCERARSDMEQGMDRARALKRLFLEMR